MSRTLRVQRTTWLADGVVRIDLCDPEGAFLPEWAPGAHVLVHLPNGVVREYSLCSDPAVRDTWSVAVLRERSSRGGSAWVHERLTAGTEVEVDGPRNNFPLDPAQQHVLIAGGIGVTPIVAMARQLARDDAAFTVLYCGRSRSGMAFLPELQEMVGERLSVHADDECGGPPNLVQQLADVDSRTLVYCCGPEPLLQAVQEAVPPELPPRCERFHAPQEDSSSNDDSDAFDVVCAGSGARVRVEAGSSILHALEDSGIDVPSSCQEGICGTCETKVLQGTPRHRDHVLTEEERESGDTMMVCVSGSRCAELVLDLP